MFQFSNQIKIQSESVQVSEVVHWGKQGQNQELFHLSSPEHLCEMVTKGRVRVIVEMNASAFILR